MTQGAAKRGAPRTITQADLDAYCAALAKELPRFALRYKDESRLQRCIGWLVRPFNARYLTDYTTVMFGRVYFPNREWCALMGPRTLYLILRHEAVHLRDMRRFPVFFQLTYVFILPVGLTFRSLWEFRAYAETMRAELELDGQIADSTIEHITAAFSGPDYLYMCPFPSRVRARLIHLRSQLYRAYSSGGSVSD